MNEDFDLDRSPATTAEYLKETKESLRVCRWVWQELITDRARQIGRRMLRVIVLVILLSLGSQLALHDVFDGVVANQSTILIRGLAGFAICMFFWRICQRNLGHNRELLIGHLLVDVDNRITELLLEKSVGQHVQEGSALSIANIDKARGRVTMVAQMLIFEGVEVLLKLGASLLGLWLIAIYTFFAEGTAVLFWPPALMTAAFVLHCAWSLFLNRKVVTEFSPIEKDWRQLNRYRVERWERVERVKTSGKEKDENLYLQAWSEEIRSRDAKFWLWFIDMLIFRGFVGWTCLVATMGLGAWFAWQGHITVGMIYPLFAWAMYVSENLWQVSRIEHQLSWNMPSVRSMMEALSLEPGTPDKPDAVQLNGADSVHVELRNVSYAYPRGSREEGGADQKMPMPALSRVSLEINPGEIVGCIGSSGAGKSTIMHLIKRNMDPDEGQVLINGVDLCDIKYISWAHKFGYIPQDAQIFDGTIRDNLLYAVPTEELNQYPDEVLWEVMRELQVDFGKRLDQGLDTKVGRNGLKLSGGQAQRLMIASAALKQPRFMIIDEATSSQDSTTERKVLAGLYRRLSKDVSALIIAHRLSTVRHLCDKFVVLKKVDDLQPGEAQVEAIAGSFEELYEISPTFRRLADDQEVVIKKKRAACSAL